MTTTLSCFKAYDIRGRVPLELNLELARQIATAHNPDIFGTGCSLHLCKHRSHIATDKAHI